MEVDGRRYIGQDCRLGLEIEHGVLSIVVGERVRGQSEINPGEEFSASYLDFPVCSSLTSLLLSSY